MPQTGPDLVSAGYPISRPLLTLLGGTTNATQSNNPARTNLDLGLGQIYDAAFPTASPGGCLSVAVPVVPGDVITKVSFLAGATALASSSASNVWAALYAGTGSAPAVLGQSTYASGSNGAAASAAAFSYTLSSPVQITSINAPYGFIYATLGVQLSATTGPSLVAMQTASVTQYQWFTNGPRFLAATHNGSPGGTAPATMSNQTAVVGVPIVVLT